jgi:ketosteroid isomerase-like protein
MSDQNKAILTEANECVSNGDYDGFLSYCTEDTEWTFIGDMRLRGKEAVWQWMKATYIQPPEFSVSHMVGEGDYVVAMGEISVLLEDGTIQRSHYCDVWRFENGKMAGLNAYVVGKGNGER